MAAYWIGTILIPGSHALVEPLPILAGQTWVISMNRHLFRPIVMPGLYLIKKFFKWRNIPLRNEVNFTYTEDEIRCIVEESHRSGRLNALENTLIKNSFDFFNLMVRDVMVPRSDMVVLNYEDEIDEMRRTISKAHHTCYPVCMDDKDHILGFIHVKDFLESLLHGEFNVKRIMRDILTVPETMPAPTLLQLMKNTRTYLAVVVDEYGSTSGLATLEDLIEELVGEIHRALTRLPMRSSGREKASTNLTARSFWKMSPTGWKSIWQKKTRMQRSAASYSQGSNASRKSGTRSSLAAGASRCCAWQVSASYA